VHALTKVLFVAALAALAAETVSMAAVAYTSTVAKGKVYLKEEETEKQEIDKTPEIDKQEVKSIFLHWGFSNTEAEELTLEIMKSPHATFARAIL
jgi:VIT1/CCC1 family predicted Fe2+/Mn2+ transporter